MLPKQVRDLRHMMDESFSIVELQMLVETLNFNWERLAGKDKISKIHNLLKRVQRGGRLDELTDFLQQNRPEVIWNALPALAKESKKSSTQANKLQEELFANYLKDLDLFIEEGQYSDTSIAMVQSLTDSAWPSLNKCQKQITINSLIDGNLFGLLTHHQRNLSGLDFRRKDLVHANLNNAILRRALLNGADLSEAYLITADLSYADLNQTNLTKANLRNATLHKANLFGAVLRQTKLQNGVLNNVDLRSADLSQANLRDVELTRADLREANLGKINLRDADLSHTSLVGANLTEALLLGADLSHADLRGADLRGANLQNAILRGAQLKGARLNQVNLRNVKNVDAFQMEKVSLEG